MEWGNSLELFADFLSVVTITMSLVLKVPQIMNLMKLQSAAGISVLGLMLELTSYTVTTCYNYTNGYSLLSYLEYPVILLQEFFLVFLVLRYLDLINSRSLLVTIIYFTLFLSFLLQLIPKTVLTLFVPLCTPISASSKVVQLLAILRSGNAESVSILTWLISAITNLTRVFTIWMDSADVILLSNFIISVALSSSIMFTAIYYKHRVKHE